MKFYISHCEISKTYTTWEVEAESFEEAVEKLNDAKYDSQVGDEMFSGIDEFDVEDHGVISPCDSLVLNNFLEE